MVLTVAPVTLGEGLSLFGRGGAERRWKLDGVVAYRSGFVEMTYERDSGGRAKAPPGQAEAG